MREKENKCTLKSVLPGIQPITKGSVVKNPRTEQTRGISNERKNDHRKEKGEKQVPLTDTPRGGQSARLGQEGREEKKNRDRPSPSL